MDWIRNDRVGAFGSYVTERQADLLEIVAKAFSAVSGYGDDLLKAKKVLEEIIVDDDRVAKDPAPKVSVMELADSSVNFAFRPFVDPELYWDVHFDMTERVKLRFDAEGISIPFPQRDIHVFQNKLLEEAVTATQVNGQ